MARLYAYDGGWMGTCKIRAADSLARMLCEEAQHHVHNRNGGQEQAQQSPHTVPKSWGCLECDESIGM